MMQHAECWKLLPAALVIEEVGYSAEITATH